MKKANNSLFLLVLIVFGLIGSLVLVGPAFASKSCDTSKSTICTIEMWLAHKQKKHNKEIRQFLKDRPVKVLRRTIQYWRPKGGHPPQNIAIGNGISAEDARWLIDLAIERNDGITMLVVQRLNPPNYAAVGTSAWDEKSLIPITPEELESLRDPSLNTAQFHQLYIKLTGEENIPSAFY
ncbi:MAG: hypothetical protein G3M70_00080 [Candidatus Nitronauta litoralis]|uniref:Uncharacterized protein n=1 Tax=Candidatus Nitronauta litoralis TaxID=2705533 RepID=A0A7T0BT14_9BACT|nr:MAG: hypothetical protein G3M70_00080 [Candidatus Nitronauta litoralis]